MDDSRWSRNDTVQLLLTSAFAFDLHQRPRQAIEELLGVRIPEIVGVRVFFERPDAFARVVRSPVEEPPADVAVPGPVDTPDGADASDPQSD